MLKYVKHIIPNDIPLLYIEPKEDIQYTTATTAIDTSIKFTSKELINPTRGRHFTSINSQYFFVIPNVTYTIYTSTGSHIYISYYDIYNHTIVQYHDVLTPIYDNDHYVANFTVPDNVCIAIISFPSFVYPSFLQIYNASLILKCKSQNYMYYYKTTFRTDSNTNVKLIAMDGTIYGENYFSYFIDSSGYLYIYSDIINRLPLSVVYDAKLNDDSIIINYIEPIIPTYNKMALHNEHYGAEYGILPTSQSLFLLGDDFIPSSQKVCLRDVIYYKKDGDVDFYYICNINSTTNKIVKERPQLLDARTIKTKHRICVDLFSNESKVIPNNIIDYTTPICYFGSEENGLTIFIDGIPKQNTEIIKSIYPNDGIIKLTKDIMSSDIMITYTTDKFRIIDSIDNLNITDTTAINISPSFSYKNIYDIETIIGTKSSGNIYDRSIELKGGEKYSFNISSMVDNDYKKIGLIYLSYSTPYITYKNNIPTNSGIINAGYNVIEFNIDDDTLSLTPNIDSYLYDLCISIIKIEENYGIFYTNNDDINIDLLTKQQITNIYNPIPIGFVRLNSNNDIYNITEILQRGGGLIDDDILTEYTNQYRDIIVPQSVEYGDIGSAANKPMNYTKYLIIELPLELLDKLIVQRTRLQENITYEELYNWAVSTVYSRLRSILPSGCFFKIYDSTTKQPWPLEKNI